MFPGLWDAAKLRDKPVPWPKVRKGWVSLGGSRLTPEKRKLRVLASGHCGEKLWVSARQPQSLQRGGQGRGGEAGEPERWSESELSASPR